MSDVRLTIDTRGLDLVKDLLKPGAEAGARILKDAIKDVMQEAPPRTGRVYLIPGTKTPYTASAEGEPPAERTSRYLNAWDNTKGFETPRGVAALAFNPVMAGAKPLGLVLEDDMNRPHLREGIGKAKPEILSLVRRMSR